MEITQFIRPFRILLLLLHLLLLLVTCLVVVSGETEKPVYIVYMGDTDDTPSEDDDAVDSRFKNAQVSNMHAAVVSDVIPSDVNAKDVIVHSFEHMNAFAAKLTAEEAKKIEGRDDVVSVFQNRHHKLHTTQSWDFIGFPQSVERNLKVESDIVIGLLDSGITPDSESFNDKGFGPPPKKWKGKCGPYTNFSGCNNKLIGATYFNSVGMLHPLEVSSPMDVIGHGSHTASTVAGSLVPNANLFGFAQGTARGAIPSARIAVYKVCWKGNDCSDLDILSGFGAAIKDGVDVLSVSIGGDGNNYANYSLAIGSFHAMKKGIITVASAGNNGTFPSTVENHAPWVFTVAASGISRHFTSKIKLGDGREISGIAINLFNTTQTAPIVTGADVAKSNSSFKDNSCLKAAIDPIKVKGKVVKCDWGPGVKSDVKGAGGVGTILVTDYIRDPEIYRAPATQIDTNISKVINKYIHSTSSASASKYKTEETNISAPFIASFSSRGPSLESAPNILKPDIAAPGLNILAAYTPLKSIIHSEGGPHFSKYKLMSGTSMACPHVAGIAGYVKSFHPKWSPAAIKSAIITTATPMSPKVHKEAEFGYGAGQVNPVAAVDPGLIYDMNETSYIQYLCQQGYKDSSLRTIVGSKTVNCSQFQPGLGTDALNYPSMQLYVKHGSKSTSGVFERIVTNVGSPQSVYNATINAPPGVEITVEPVSLSFTKLLEKKSFKVVVNSKAKLTSLQPLSGELIWSSSHGYRVRSPIVVYTYNEIFNT